MKYGSLALSFVQTGHLIAIALPKMISPDPEKNHNYDEVSIDQEILCLVSSFLALLVCLIKFRETLDLKNLLQRKLIIFENFGILQSGKHLNYRAESWTLA